MRKAILFPFETAKDIYFDYVQVMELAKMLNLPVILFTSISPKSTESELDEVYFNLLKLNGYYRTHFNYWEVNNPVEVCRIIKRGRFQNQLNLFIESGSKEFLIYRSVHGAKRILN